MSGLVERLRAKQVVGYTTEGNGEIVSLRNPDGPEAASRIEALEGEVERLRDALRPFGDIAHLEDTHGSLIGHPDIYDYSGSTVTVGGLSFAGPSMGAYRAARSLSQSEEESR